MFLKVILVLPTDSLYYFCWRRFKIGSHNGLQISEEWTNAQWTDGMCANLQVVQINNYIRWLPLSFMKLILSKASLLRTLSVDVCPVSQDDPLNELLKCRRASAQAQVLFKVKKPFVGLQTSIL